MVLRAPDLPNNKFPEFYGEQYIIKGCTLRGTFCNATGYLKKHPLIEDLRTFLIEIRLILGVFIEYHNNLAIYRRFFNLASLSLAISISSIFLSAFFQISMKISY